MITGLSCGVSFTIWTLQMMFWAKWRCLSLSLSHSGSFTALMSTTLTWTCKVVIFNFDLSSFCDRTSMKWCELSVQTGKMSCCMLQQFTNTLKPETLLIRKICRVEPTLTARQKRDWNVNSSFIENWQHSCPSTFSDAIMDCLKLLQPTNL